MPTHTTTPTKCGGPKWPVASPNAFYHLILRIVPIKSIYSKYTLTTSGDDLVLLSPTGVTIVFLATLDEIVELGEEEWKNHIRIKDNGNGPFAYLNMDNALERVDMKELFSSTSNEEA